MTDVPALRARLAAAAAATAQPRAQELDDPRVHVETVHIPRADGSVLDVVLFRPVGKEHAQPALLWFHAGGQVLGTAHDDAAYHASLALKIDCVFAAVDYRLAPETQAPGAADDGGEHGSHTERAAAPGQDRAERGLLTARPSPAEASPAEHAR